MFRFLCATLLLAISIQAASALSAAEIARNLAQIKLPAGFEIGLYASDVENARQMARGANGTLFVGSRSAGVVHALADTDGDGTIDQRHLILKKGQRLPDGTEAVMPSGIAFKDGSLYVAAVSHVLRWDNIESRLGNPGEPVIVTDKLPDYKHHGWKFIDFGPDGKLYFSVGAWCNICENDDQYFATINRMNADGSQIEVLARGVRNTVGFDWHPQTGELWFTENGGDNMGNDIPADELNRISRIGEHFGYPHVHQGDILDERYGQGHTLGEFTPPAMNLGPHVAALGMIFYEGSMLPAKYKNQIFIAEHGSWNRPIGKIGYRLTIVGLNGNEAISYEDFASGWLQGNDAWGRPVDVLELPDGSILVSDDFANAIYRITYSDS